MSEIKESKLEILEKYSQLLNESPETRTILSQDKDVSKFLLDILVNSDDQKVIRTTLEILFELISCDGNKAKIILSSDLNYQKCLAGLIEKFKIDTNIKFIGEAILGQCFPDYYAASKTAAASNTMNRSRTSRFLVGSNRPQAKTIVFQSTGFVDQDVRRSVEQSLIKTKGVVSIYFDSSSSTNKIWRCIVRVWTNIFPQVIADAILSVNRVSNIQQVSKDEYGEEILISYQKEEEKSSLSNEKSSMVPSYLDENDDYTFGVVIGDRALTKFGDKENTNKAGGGWLSGVSSFFSKTLYW